MITGTGVHDRPESAFTIDWNECSRSTGIGVHDPPERAVTDRKAGFRSLGDTWADTTTPHGRLMLAVLGGLAEFERDLIRARTSEGRARAVTRGVRLGRKPKLTPHQRKEILRRKDSGEAVREIARSYNVHNSTISRVSGATLEDSDGS